MLINKINKYNKQTQVNSVTFSPVGGYNIKYWPDVSKGPLDGHAWMD